MNPGGAGGPAGDDGLTDNSETITISSLALLKMLKRKFFPINVVCPRLSSSDLALSL